MAKRPAGNAGAGISELYGVQNVKELCAKFELGLFAPERCDFGNFKIEVCPAGTSERIPRKVAVSAQCGIGCAGQAS